jgi:nitrogen PTS system EIIA component
MLISDLILESCVVPDLSGRNKEEVLRNLSEVLAGVLPDTSAGLILEVFIEREQLGSTGIGKGIAIPHGRLEGLKEPIAVLGRSIAGVSFAASDNKPVHLFIALLSPVESGQPHLKALSAISRLLNKKLRRGQLLAAKDQKSLYNAAILEEREE